MNTLRQNCILKGRILNSRRKTKEVLKSYCGNPTRTSLRTVMDAWRVKFENSNIPEANISAQLIAAHILQISDIDKLNSFDNCELNNHQITEFNRCGECRLARIPLQYIVKQWDFRDVKLKLVPPVFIPRPETEMLVDIIVDNTHNVQRGLEIGCGSGAISIALLKTFPKLRMDAIDQSKTACDLTAINAAVNEVEDRLNVCKGKIAEEGLISNYEVEAPIDFIVSNPPYLFTAELLQLEPEVQLYEDLRALDGGRDGLRVIKAIFLFSSKMLAQSKSCFVETHHLHASMIQKWLEKNSHLNLQYCRVFKDLFGKDRFVWVMKR